MENDKDQGWRDRLRGALAERGMSMRSISLGAGLGPGVVNSWFKEGKDPSMSNLLAVCQFAQIDTAYILFGFHINEKTAELLRLLEEHPDRRDGILQLLHAK